jgi:hypothetical protein
VSVPGRHRLDVVAPQAIAVANVQPAVGNDGVRQRLLARTGLTLGRVRGHEPATGRVLVSELVVDDRTVRATIEVSFQSEPLLDMLVPVAMQERYEGKKTGSIVEGRATYGRFRRLEP